MSTMKLPPDTITRQGAHYLPELVDGEASRLWKKRYDEMIVTCKYEAEQRDKLKAENGRLRAAMDNIYNHNEAARAAVIQHYGLWHSPALKEDAK